MRRGKLPTAGRQLSPKAPLGLYIWKQADFAAGRCDESAVGHYAIVQGAAIVRRGFDEYELPASVETIALGLNRDGLKTATGGAWTANSVYRMLKNPAYKGMAAYGRRRNVIDDSRAEGGKARTYTVRRAAAEIQYIPCPAIVSPEQWERVNARMTAGRAKFSGRKDRVSALTSLLHCPACESVLHCALGYYRCKNRQCERPSFAAAVVEQAVFEELFRLRPDVELKALLESDAPGHEKRAALALIVARVQLRDDRAPEIEFV